MIENFLDEYCENEMLKLKQLCFPIIIKIGGISEKDYDDFYSIALDALADSVLRFDETKDCQFKTFLVGNIKRKFNTEIRDRNRAKRIPSKKIESMSNLVTDSGLELEDTLPSNFDTFEVACGYLFKGTKIERYLHKLSNTQRRIVSLLSEGFKPNEIKEILHISNKEYSQNLSAIQAYENVRELM